MAKITNKSNSRQRVKAKSFEPKTTVITHIQIEGFHYWADAPERVKFLRNNHRHLFTVRCGFAVKALDREIEIFLKQWEIVDWFRAEFGTPATFNGLSCEHIATMVVNQFNCEWCEVLEDGLGGARVER